MTIWRVRIACWIPRAINILSEHVRLIAFPVQQWLHEGTSMLRYTYIVYIVINGTVCSLRGTDWIFTYVSSKSPQNLERWDIHSHEWKRSENGWMERQKAMEYGSRKASSDVLKPHYIYIYIYIYIYKFSSYRFPSVGIIVYQRPSLNSIYMFRLPKEQSGTAWEPAKQQYRLRNQEVLDTKCCHFFQPSKR